MEPEMFTGVAGLLRYAIGSWPRTLRLLAFVIPALAAVVAVRLVR